MGSNLAIVDCCPVGMCFVCKHSNVPCNAIPAHDPYDTVDKLNALEHTENEEALMIVA